MGNEGIDEIMNKMMNDMHKILPDLQFYIQKPFLDITANQQDKKFLDS